MWCVGHTIHSHTFQPLAVKHPGAVPTVSSIDFQQPAKKLNQVRVLPEQADVPLIALEPI